MKNKRPCEQHIQGKRKIYTPKDINLLASSVTGFCDVISEEENIEVVHRLALAIKDNWLRFMESA